MYLADRHWGGSRGVAGSWGAATCSSPEADGSARSLTEELMNFAMTGRHKAQLQAVPTPWGQLVGVKSDRITKTILSDGQYEWAETAIVAQLLRAGATAIDVGANIGYYTALFRCLVGPRGAVHSFEANPFTAAVLKLGMAKNGWDDVVVNAMAAGDVSGAVTVKPMEIDLALADNNLNLGGWSMREAKGGDWQIPVMPLDQYVRDKKIEKVHFLKIDVEGFELKVLQGAEFVVRKLRPYIIVEMRSTGPVQRQQCELMVDQFEHDDFVCCRIVKRPFPHFRALAKGDLDGSKFHFNLLAIPSSRYREFIASVNGRVVEPQA
jgi:FkbM family methyltransferase